MKLVSAVTVALFVTLPLATAGCGSTTSPTAPTTTPAAPTTTETFAGALAQSGSNIHPFMVSQVGEVDATLASVTPLNTIALGFVLGTYDGTNCIAAYENDNSRQGQSLSGVPTSSGMYCVRVFDVGNVAPGAAINYTVTVAHP
jgi:hypothetical protein